MDPKEIKVLVKAFQERKLVEIQGDRVRDIGMDREETTDGVKVELVYFKTEFRRVEAADIQYGVDVLIDGNAPPELK